MSNPPNGEEASRLPRLLYVGDVPVEASFHGSALIYRLLDGYPTEDLLVVEGSVGRSSPERRLPDTTYRELDLGQARWLRTRLRRLAAATMTLAAPRARVRLEATLGSFQPEAVLTVAHGFSWLAAAEFARARTLPLHLIVHDDWPIVANLPWPAASWLDQRFGRTYRQAVSRLCVSPRMMQDFERRYGPTGDVLYPSWARSMSPAMEPPERPSDVGRPIVFAYGGTINSDAQVGALRQLAETLASNSGVLLLYCPHSREEIQNAGLELPNVRLMGLVPSADFVRRMREDVDVLFAPMSFDPGERSIMMTCFPSKLSDYSATGLPILLYGPPESSAVQWARENIGAAEVVDKEGPTELLSSVRRLIESPAYRVALGQGALRAGWSYFSSEIAQGIFRGALARSFCPPPVRSANRAVVGETKGD